MELWFAWIFLFLSAQTRGHFIKKNFFWGTARRHFGTAIALYAKKRTGGGDAIATILSKVFQRRTSGFFLRLPCRQFLGFFFETTLYPPYRIQF